MEGIDTKTMIHIGTELLLIGGLGFWMKKRVDASDARIEDLTNKLAAYEEIITQQQTLLSRHETMLRQLYGMPPLQQAGGQQQGPPQQGSPQQPGSQQQGPPPATNSRADIPSPSAKPAPKAKASPVQNPPASVEILPEEKDISPEDLDKILREELSQTQSIEIDTADPEDLNVKSEEHDHDSEALKPKRKVVAVRKKKTT